MALCQDDEIVAKIVEDNHVKVIIQLALDSTIDGKIRAGLALARIVVRIQHDIAFPYDMVSVNYLLKFFFFLNLELFNKFIEIEYHWPNC